MKKIILTIALIAAAAISANAQLRIEAGIGAGDYSSNDAENTGKTRMTPQVRAMYQIYEFGQNAGIELGVGLAGHKLHSKEIKTTVALTNVDIPVHAFYNLDFGGVVITPMIGLYAGFAAKGTLKVGDTKINMYSDDYDDPLKRFDIGMDDELLLTFREHFTVAIGGQVGFLNLSPVKDVHIKSNSMFVSVGWKF